MSPRGSQGSQQVFRAKPAVAQGSLGRTGSNGMSDESSWCAVSENAGSNITASARRNKVYEKIMKEWQEAASSAIPRPRSSHRRILGGQALPTRERGESLSRENKSGSLPLSWGNLSDTVSPAVQSAWREQLLELKLSRLAGVPKTVLLRQRTRSSLGTVDGCRIVTTPQTLSAKLAALAVIEGTCSNVPLYAAATSSPLHFATESSHCPRGSEGETMGKVATAATRGGFHQGREEQQLQQPGRQGRCDNASGANGQGAEGSGFIAEAREEVDASRGCANAPTPPVSVVTSGTGNLSGSADRGERSGATTATATPPLPGQAKPLPAKHPVERGFHLVDLHAVVRNSVEWSHCLPKVEPCFRVGSNRDIVLLGLVHALGARLSCSSAHDVKAGVRGARGASPVPAPPPRLLDRHMCRSPALLRSSVAAGIQLFEVDCADELRRIRAARRPKRRVSATSRSRGAPTPAGALGEKKETSPRPVTASSIPTGVLVRLAVPPRSPGKLRDGSEATAAATVGDFSGALEAAYGARAEDLVELVRAAAAAEESEVGPAPSGGGGGDNGNGSSSPLRIVGFSIDVGSSCVEDAHAGGASALPARDHGRPGASALGGTGVAPGEAVASAALAESIDAAVAFAVEMAGVAAAAAAAAVASAGEVATTPHADTANDVTSGEVAAEEAAVEHPRPAEGSGVSESAAASAAMPTSSPQPASPPPFSFQRLHVTGLGDGGARGEPLAALKAALSRHLPIASAVKTTLEGNGRSGAGGAGTSSLSTPASRPIVVSADATEHLVARGVWSTVASIIGRKSVPPVVNDDDEEAGDDGDAAATARPSVGGEHADQSGYCPCIAGEGSCYPAGEAAIPEGGGAGGDGGGGGGAMYYVDDGCYGSLSGALLRGVQMQPSPLRVRRRPPSPPPPPPTTTTTLIQPDHSPSGPLCTAGASPGETNRDRRNNEAGAGSSADASPPGTPPEPTPRPRAKELPCTVWGPTCDGLDCVCRMTQLPDDLEPGQDWLFFPDVGIRGRADVTDFNGLRPLDPFYLIRQRDDTASPAPAPAPTARRAPAARAVSP